MAYADEHHINVSRADLKSLAVGFLKSIPVVTDDIGMKTVADANAIECWSTIKLLRVMFTSSRIGMEEVTQVLEYWSYENDLPQPRAKFRQACTEYFGTACPI